MKTTKMMTMGMLAMTGLLNSYAMAAPVTQVLSCSNGSFSFKTELGPLHTAGAIELNGSLIPNGVVNCELDQNNEGNGNSCPPGAGNCFVGAPPAPSLPMFCGSPDGVITVNAGFGGNALVAQIASQPGNDFTRVVLANLKCEVTSGN